MGNAKLKRMLSRMRMPLGALMLGLVVPLTGCPFFICQKASCPTGSGTGTTGTGDYVYVSNSTSGTNYISAYTIGSGTLTPVSGSPFQIPFEPVAMAVSTNDDYLYVVAPSGSSSAGIWVYTISSTTGGLSGGTQINDALVGAMTVSPDGNYLYTVDSGTGSILQQYSFASNGGLTAGPQGAIANGNGCGFVSTPISQQCSIAVSPQNNFVAVSTGLAGTAIFPYSSTGGGITASAPSVTIPVTNGYGQYSLGFDDSNFLYVADTNAVTPYAITSNSETAGNPMTVSGTTGTTPRSVALAPGYGFLFTADEGSSQISTFTVSGGVLAPASSSPQAGPQNVSAVGVERSGTYLLAAGYSGTNGLSMYTFSSIGISTSPVATEATESNTQSTIPVIMAFTH